MPRLGEAQQRGTKEAAQYLLLFTKGEVAYYLEQLQLLLSTSIKKTFFFENVQFILPSAEDSSQSKPPTTTHHLWPRELRDVGGFLRKYVRPRHYGKPRRDGKGAEKFALGKLVERERKGRKRNRYWA